jgi:hypothetical protein
VLGGENAILEILINDEAFYTVFFTSYAVRTGFDQAISDQIFDTVASD